MPTARTSFGAAIYQNKIYCLGGLRLEDKGKYTTIPTGANEVYDPSTDTWETKAPMSTARYGFDANVVEGKIYLIGGWYGSDKSAQVDIYDPLTDTWTIGMPMPTAVAEYASAVVDNKIYVFSGVASGASITNLTQVYDPKTDLWSYGASISMGVKNAAAGAITGANVTEAIYVAGGNNATYPLNAQSKVQVYFPRTDSWSIAAPMPIDRAGLGATVVNNTLFVVGGGHNIFTPDSTLLMQYTPFSLGEPEYSPTVPLVTVVVLVVAVVIALLLVHLRSRWSCFSVSFSSQHNKGSNWYSQEGGYQYPRPVWSAQYDCLR
jgi:N-acetylneuraminic acid mutarotase